MSIVQSVETRKEKRQLISHRMYLFMTYYMALVLVISVLNYYNISYCYKKTILMMDPEISPATIVFLM